MLPRVGLVKLQGKSYIPWNRDHSYSRNIFTLICFLVPRPFFTFD